MLKLAIFEFIKFGFKQAWACLFAGALLFAILVTHYWYPFAWLPRYDFLFLYAIFIQGILLVSGLENKKDALVILVFHVVATIMEIFKTSDSIGAWNYPGDGYIKIGNVPLFAGFMYSAVGSYLARVWDIFDFRFTHFPSLPIVCILSCLIYINFFSHHYIYDLRYVLIAGIFIIMIRTSVHFRIDLKHRVMPLLFGMLLVALFIWFAENIATFCKVWFYPSQVNGWTVVSPSKITAWFLLMFISFALIACIKSIKRPNESLHRTIN
jgi:uncharacterized membrane protein YoaT (DUF817 family)